MWVRAWDYNNPDKMETVTMKGAAIHVWGCISALGYGKLVLLDGTLTGIKYRDEILNVYVLEMMNDHVIFFMMETHHIELR